MTGTRFTRTDISVGLESFFRAPYSYVSLFVMYLAGAALLHRSSARTLTPRSGVLLFASVALLFPDLAAQQPQRG